MLNMPEEAGGRGLSMLGQVALEEESGKATNGLGFAVVDRGPAELWDIATPAQREQFVAPVAPRGVPRGLGGHRARRWLGRERDRRDRRARRGRMGAERREVVRDERRRPRLLPRARGGRGRADALHRRAVAAGPANDEHAGVPARSLPRSPPRDRPHELPRTGGRTASPRAAARARRSGSSSSGSSSRRAAAAPPQRSLDLAPRFALEREAFGARSPSYQGVSFQLADSLTELLAARLLTYHAAHAFDDEPDRRVVHGKVAMAKLYASEAAGRIVDRALQVLGGPRLHAGEPGGALLPRGAGRPHLGGHERDPAPDRLARPLQARRRDVPDAEGYSGGATAGR